MPAFIIYHKIEKDIRWLPVGTYHTRTTFLFFFKPKAWPFQFLKISNKYLHFCW